MFNLNFSFFSHPDITVNELAEGIKVICPENYEPKETILEKRDNNTEEYKCKNSENKELKIYVKFRSKFRRINCVCEM